MLDIIKAFKSNSGYEIWLRHYRDKRRKKQDEYSTKKAVKILENNSYLKNKMNFSNKDVRDMSVQDLLTSRDKINSILNDPESDTSAKDLLMKDLKLIESEFSKRTNTTNMEKAQKGTPQYSEWLRKYRLHYADSGDFFEKQGQAYKILESRGNRILVENQEGEISEMDLTQDIEDQKYQELNDFEDTLNYVQPTRNDVKIMKNYLRFREDLDKQILRTRYELSYLCPENADRNLWNKAVEISSEQHKKFSKFGLENRASISDVIRTYTRLLAQNDPETFLKINNNLEKAQKVTAKYEEWLSKYREKRGKK